MVIDYKTCTDYPDRCHKSGECWYRCTLNPNVKPLGFELHGNQLRLDDRRIGWITKIGDKIVFVSPRRELPHKMRIYRGYGISEAVLNWLKEHDVEEVHLRIGDRRILMATIDQWFKEGIYGQFQNFEPQLFLQEKHFKESKRTLAELTP